MSPELRRRHATPLGSDLIVPNRPVPGGPRDDRPPAVAERARERSAKEMDERHRQVLDARPLTVYCALCGWTAVGPAGDCRAMAKDHRETAHPKAGKAKLRRGEGLKHWSRKGPTPEQSAEAEARRLIHERAARRDG